MGLSFKGIKKQVNTFKNVVSNPGAAAKNPKGVFQDLLQGSDFSTGDTFRIGANLAPMFDAAPKKPNAGEDPNVTALRDRLYGEAEKFATDLPGMQKSATNQIEAEGDLALKSGLKGTKEGFNRRGLLYSGLRQAGEQGVKGKVASTMASQKAESNKDLTNMAKAKFQKAAQVGLQGYQDAVSREAEIEGISLQNQVARAQMMQQLGQTGGYLAGRNGGYFNSAPTNNYSQQFRQGNLAADSNGYGGYSGYNPDWMTA